MAMIPLSSNLPSHKLFSIFSATLVTFLVLIARKVHCAETTHFNFNGFKIYDPITLHGTSNILANGILALTNDENPIPNTGHALYSTPIRIWDSSTGNVASFVTSFSFVIENITHFVPADGFIFFLAPPNIKIPEHSSAGNLGIVDATDTFNRFIGVEFDNYPNNNRDPASPHIGIDVNSLLSLNHVKWNWMSGSLNQVNIIYDSLFKTLSVSVTDQFGQISNLAQVIDLKAVLPERIRVGFSASTSKGGCQKHTIHSWSFTSTLETGRKTSNNTETINNDNIATSV